MGTDSERQKEDGRRHREHLWIPYPCHEKKREHSWESELQRIGIRHSEECSPPYSSPWVSLFTSSILHPMSNGLIKDNWT